MEHVLVRQKTPNLSLAQFAQDAVCEHPLLSPFLVHVTTLPSPETNKSHQANGEPGIPRHKHQQQTWYQITLFTLQNGE